jgi:hypothetical protein
LAAFFVAILPVLPVIKRVRCEVLFAANEGIDLGANSVKKNRWFNAFFLYEVGAYRALHDEVEQLRRMSATGRSSFRRAMYRKMFGGVSWVE